MAGAGKSWTIKHMYTKDDLVLCKTHLACENLKDVGVSAQTIDSYLFDPKTQTLNMKPLEKVKRLICDEYTMIPPTEMDTILRAKEKYGFTLILLGDKDQCRSLDTMWVNYIQNKRLLEAFNGRIVRLSYKGYRYNDALYHRLVVLQNSGVMNLPDNNIVPSYYNLCLNDKARHPVNAQCFERWVAEHRAEVVVVNGMKVALDLEVMCYDNNDLERGIYKTNRFMIQSIGPSEITLRRKEKVVTLSHKEFTGLFDYSFCVTIYKFQGGQINEHINIYQADQMSRNELFTCVSRGFSPEKIHIDKLRDGRYEWDREQHVHIAVTPPPIRTGRIYCITFEGSTYSYIGKTTQTLAERLEGHMRKPTNKQMKEAFASGATPKITLLDEFKYSSEKVFSTIEKYFIENADNLLNVCYNVKDIVKKVKADVAMKKDKFRITHDESKKRYIIRYSVDGKEVRERFSYSACKQEEALAAAEARQVILRQQ